GAAADLTGSAVGPGGAAADLTGSAVGPGGAAADLTGRETRSGAAGMMWPRRALFTYDGAVPHTRARHHL
ncbi:hypothetical protein, partial [Streptomyces hygroscopicus]|uniref:hypothetical protein n=1 Tax=Streptomyces hygroscopicus TaxID=1912 RepID=UPI001C65BDBA